jgi:hypothetical protein
MESQFPCCPQRNKKKERQKMNKLWKWIIGILSVLVVVAVLVGVGFMVRSNFHGYRANVQASPGFSQRGPEILPYHGFEYMRGPGMMRWGMMPFGGFFGGLFSLGFLVLVVLGIIWLARQVGTQRPVEVPATMPATIPAAIVNPCKKCGKPIQDDWIVCPHCGKKV